MKSTATLQLCLVRINLPKEEDVLEYKILSKVVSLCNEVRGNSAPMVRPGGSAAGDDDDDVTRMTVAMTRGRFRRDDVVREGRGNGDGDNDGREEEDYPIDDTLCEAYH